MAGPTAPPTAATLPSGAPGSLSGAVDQRLATTSATGAYFGQVMPSISGVQTSGDVQHGGVSVYGPYDPSAIVPYSGAIGAPGSQTFINVNQAANMYYTWTPQEQNDFRAKLSLLDTNYTTASDANLANMWASLVNQSAAYHAAGTNITPWDILAKDIASNSGGKGVAGQTIDKTISTTQLTSAPDSNAIFQAAAAALIGRAPTADEMKNFQSNLNAQERANPVVQQKQLTYSPQGYVVDTNVLKSSGGETDAARQQLAMEKLRGTSEYADYQASTTYMGALQELLSGGKV